MLKSSIKIGVSGDKGSFSEIAAKNYIKKAGLKAGLVYLIDMEGVLKSLDKGKIGLGIFPVSNSAGGLVKEAFKAMGSHRFVLVDEIKIPVKHCLLGLAGQALKNIKKIYSYSQGFIQCAEFLKTNFGTTKLAQWHDTAKAARDLSMGKFGRNSAVIASASAAQIYGLRILRSNIQDSKDNLTTFIVVKRR